MKKKVFYWSPSIGKVATNYAVINSAYSIKMYSKEYQSYLIDACGEWNEYLQEIELKKIKLIEFGFKYFDYLPKYGFVKSRISYFLIFIFSSFNFYKMLKLYKPNFLICHLITSLPLMLFYFFNFESKLILRISGFPKLNVLRKIFWKITGKKIYKVTCPTVETLNWLKKHKIFEEKQLILLRDPIINLNRINQLAKNQDIDHRLTDKKYILSIGRLTKQKNHELLINFANYILKEGNNLNFVIIGSGDNEKYLKEKIKKFNIEDKVFLLGYKKNVFKYLKKAQYLISTSLWEDPGWVMIESAVCNTIVISSNCPSGPKEFIGTDRGFLFENNSLSDLIKQYYQLQNLDEKKKKLIKINAKKESKKYTLFNHYKTFENELLK